MKVLRRSPVQVFSVGDLVKHQEHGTGVVDTISCVGARRYFVSQWNGRGQKPRLFSVPRFVSLGIDLRPAEPLPVFIVRRR